MARWERKCGGVRAEVWQGQDGSVAKRAEVDGRDQKWREAATGNNEAWPAEGALLLVVETESEAVLSQWGKREGMAGGDRTC